MQDRLPEGVEVTWTVGEYTLGAQKIACDVANWNEGTITRAVWFSSAVPCGGVVKSQVSGKDTFWLSGHGVKASEPEHDPKREPGPDSILGPRPARDYGAPITMALPDKVAKAMKDQGMAITRMRVYFEEEKNSNDGAVIEFEGMRTEVPVIYAAFKGEQCDRELSYDDWLKREARHVDLAFEIKSRPKVLKGMKVQVVHGHLQGDTETDLNTYDITVPEPGEAWDTLRLPGAKPGINRYTIVVSYTNNDETTTHRGFSHWVVVQAPPMFEFLNTVTAKASRTEAAGNTALEADVNMSGTFLLHHGLDPKDCTMRITRKGKRDMDLSKLPAGLRRVIDKERVPPGWQEVARVKFSDAKGSVGATVDVEDDFVRVTWHHGFAASAAVLPVTDEWEYRFELLHRGSATPLASWTANIDLSIAKTSDIANAKLKVRATGLEKPLEVVFTKK
jgi:hypothetical protein